jgi:predicted nucleic acid-binding protein
MSVVVSDTSPINYLVLIGRIELLEKIYGRVIIPLAVFDELQRAATPSEPMRLSLMRSKGVKPPSIRASQ